jgi:hypothetical protein
MAKGGYRPNAGRKKGSVNAATLRRREIADQALTNGVTPLDVMLTTMRALWDEAIGEDGKIKNLGKAMQANMVAKEAAPFVHPKLASTQVSGGLALQDVSDEPELTEDEWKARHSPE